MFNLSRLQTKKMLPPAYHPYPNISKESRQSRILKTLPVPKQKCYQLCSTYTFANISESSTGPRKGKSTKRTFWTCCSKGIKICWRFLKQPDTNLSQCLNGKIKNSTQFSLIFLSITQEYAVHITLSIWRTSISHPWAFIPKKKLILFQRPK